MKLLEILISAALWAAWVIINITAIYTYFTS